MSLVDRFGVREGVASCGCQGTNFGQNGAAHRYGLDGKA